MIDLLKFIVDSEVWDQEPHVRIVFVTLCCLAKKNGATDTLYLPWDVGNPIEKLSGLANIHYEATVDALAQLSHLDRLREQDFGWLVWLDDRRGMAAE